MKKRSIKKKRRPSASVRKPMHRPGHTHSAATDFKRRPKFQEKPELLDEEEN